MRDIPEDLKAVKLPRGYYYDFTDPITHMITSGKVEWSVAVYHTSTDGFVFTVCRPSVEEKYAASKHAWLWVERDDLQELIDHMCTLHRLGVK